MTDTHAAAARRDWAVVTANMAGYDEVHAVPSDAAVADWVYVTDNRATAERADALGWRVVLHSDDESPFLRSRYPKVRPDEFTDRSCSVYIDARYIVESEGVVDELASHLPERAWLALFRHDDRASVYEEADECQRLGIGGSHVVEQMAHYRETGVKHPTGLWCGGVMARRHCDAQSEFGDAWFDELTRWPTRDQLSLPVVLHRHGVVPVELPGSAYSWPGLRVTPHLVPRPGRNPSEARRRPILKWLRWAPES